MWELYERSVEKDLKFELFKYFVYFVLPILCNICIGLIYPFRKSLNVILKGDGSSNDLLTLAIYWIIFHTFFFFELKLISIPKDYFELSIIGLYWTLKGLFSTYYLVVSNKHRINRIKFNNENLTNEISQNKEKCAVEKCFKIDEHEKLNESLENRLKSCSCSVKLSSNLLTSDLLNLILKCECKLKNNENESNVVITHEETIKNVKRSIDELKEAPDTKENYKISKIITHEDGNITILVRKRKRHNLKSTANDVESTEPNTKPNLIRPNECLKENNLYQKPSHFKNLGNIIEINSYKRMRQINEVIRTIFESIFSRSKKIMDI